MLNIQPSGGRLFIRLAVLLRVLEMEQRNEEIKIWMLLWLPTVGVGFYLMGYKNTR
ncbi:hypothetical protein F652_3093 [Enterobacteriaceae bacterium bta3-1]|nr:hypothetical protein F652_3093 [Enterobacteriaceae bacterium bta3-1]